MRQVLYVISGAMLAISFLFGFFALRDANQQEIDLSSRLQSRSQILAESLAENIEPALATRATSSLQRTFDRFVTKERLAGLGAFDSDGLSISVSSDLPLPKDEKFLTNVMDSHESRGEFVRIAGETFYTFAQPVFREGTVIGALVVVQNASYIDEEIAEIWRTYLIRWFSVVFIFGIAIFILVRIIFVRSIRHLTNTLSDVRKNDVDIEIARGAGFLRPLTGELAKVAQSLRQARHAASEEARMRHEELDSPWTAERLKEFIKVDIKSRPIFVVSNREPYIHTHARNGIEVSMLANGMNTAMDSVMEACEGTWIAHGSGDADKEVVDNRDRVRVPPDHPTYTLKRVWLTDEEVDHYYKGFSVEGLYPLSLMAHIRPQFREEDWAAYKAVNVKFAKVVLEEIRNVERPILLVQDYHFMLLPRIIKRARPDAQIGVFWHVPWTSAEAFGICPWRKELLDGILGADLIAFNTQQFCNNFIETVGNEMESQIDIERFAITKHGHVSLIRTFPISIAFTNGKKDTKGAEDANLKRLGIDTEFLVLGVDRLDYSKGIPERLRAIEHFFTLHPEFKEKCTFLQIASPHRENIPQYAAYKDVVISETSRINEKFQTRNWKPIVIEHRQYSHAELSTLYKRANACLITSLHDSMNLVSKEYVAARNDEEGVLILSHFAGASRDMNGALIINPYDVSKTGEAIYQALTMAKTEQHRRMKKMRASVRDYNVYRWSAELIKALSRIE